MFSAVELVCRFPTAMSKEIAKPELYNRCIAKLHRLEGVGLHKMHTLLQSEYLTLHANTHLQNGLRLLHTHICGH